MRGTSGSGDDNYVIVFSSLSSCRVEWFPYVILYCVPISGQWCCVCHAVLSEVHLDVSRSVVTLSKEGNKVNKINLIAFGFVVILDE